MVSELVTHDSHDVVTVEDESSNEDQGDDGNLPEWDGELGCSSVTGVPGAVDDGPRRDGVSDVVGAVSEGGCAGSDQLDEGVGVLDLVGVLCSVRVDLLHTCALWGTLKASLGSVDVVVHTVEGTGDKHGGHTLAENLDVMKLVNSTRAHLVLVKVSHSPTHGTRLLAKLGVESLVGDLLELFVADSAGLLAVSLAGVVERGGLHGGGGVDSNLLLVDAVDAVGSAVGAGSVGVVLDDTVVGDVSSLGSLGVGSSPKERTLEDVDGSEGLVLLDDLAVKPWDEEEGSDQSKTDTCSKRGGSDEPSRLLVETEVGRTLVDNGQSANSSGDEEEERCGPDGPWDGVFADVNDELDEAKDDSTESGRAGGSHEETREDGTETLSVVPTPLNVASASRGNTDTGDGRDEGVGRRDVSGVACAPHDPG